MPVTEPKRAHLAGMTAPDLVRWAGEHGATREAGLVLARFLLGRFAGRRVDDRPARRLLDAAARELDDSLPLAEAVPDADGTVRFAVTLSDGEVVETVLIRQSGRDTVCVSSQAGCARGCVFCETGRLGLRRNLTAAEIVSQYALAVRFLMQARASSASDRRSEPGGRRRAGLRPVAGGGGCAKNGGEVPHPIVPNLVFMGMGEPLDNLDEVVRAIDALIEPLGFAVPVRRITVSTVGIVPKMDELYARTKANVAVSLHAIDAPTRLALLPVARRWPLDELRAAIARSPRPVLLQWTLLAGVNDSDAHADALTDFVLGRGAWSRPQAATPGEEPHGFAGPGSPSPEEEPHGFAGRQRGTGSPSPIDVRVNLIPANAGPDPKLIAPPLQRVRAFQKRLADAGVRTLVRMPHGQSVGGACGQLAGARRLGQA